MSLAGICFRGLTKRSPIREGCVENWSFYYRALRRSNSIATRSTPSLFRRTVWCWSLQHQALNTRLISSHIPGFGSITTRSMGSGGSKDKDKKGKASEEGEQQAQGQAEKPVSEGTSEQQQKQQQAEVEQTAARAESETTMAEEYVEAVVAKASEFGDNE